jgi:hypothetical protein
VSQTDHVFPTLDPIASQLISGRTPSRRTKARPKAATRRRPVRVSAKTYHRLLDFGFHLYGLYQEGRVEFRSDQQIDGLSFDDLVCYLLDSRYRHPSFVVARGRKRAGGRQRVDTPSTTTAVARPRPNRSALIGERIDYNGHAPPNIQLTFDTHARLMAFMDSQGERRLSAAQAINVLLDRIESHRERARDQQRRGTAREPRRTNHFTLAFTREGRGTAYTTPHPIHTARPSDSNAVELGPQTKFVLTSPLLSEPR